MDIKKAFGLALKKARKSKLLTQEDFSEVSSRTYISSLERGKKSITLEKLEEISETLKMHPISVMCLTYLIYDENQSIDNFINLLNQELSHLTIDKKSTLKI